jgi:hypothetical protein
MLFIFLRILETYMNFYEYIKYYEIGKQIKKEKLRVGRIRLEAEGLLGAAAYCGSRPSRPDWHGPAATWPARAQRGARTPPVVTAWWRAGATDDIQPGDKVWGNWQGQLT